MVAGGALAAFEPMLWVLAISACGLGVGWMVIAAASQYAIGMYGAGSEEKRIRAFSIMSMGFSISSFLGPLIAGFMIDQTNFQATFALLACFPLVAALLFYVKRFLKLPSIEHKVRDAPPGKASELLQIPIVRNTLMTGAVITIGWDLYIFVVPVLGSHIGLTATQIGSVMSLFAVAVFLVRFAMPRLQRWLGGRGVIVAAMIVSGSAFIAFTFADTYAAMLTISFVMGLGLGSSQPIVLSFLHAASPPNRIGEVNGLRMTMISTSQWTMPLVFGILSAKTGLLPLFLLVGSGLVSGSWFAKKRLPDKS
jgi:MFS family permease